MLDLNVCGLRRLSLLILLLLAIQPAWALQKTENDLSRIEKVAVRPPEQLDPFSGNNPDGSGLFQLEPITDTELLTRLASLYRVQADLLEAHARQDEQAVVEILDDGMNELGDLLRRQDLVEDPRFGQAYKLIVSEYERVYGPADTLFAAFGDIFDVRREMIAALEDVEDPLLEDVIPSSLQPVGTTVPMTMNRLVESSMDFLLRERREVLQAWLSRADTYFPMIEQIFREEGVPDEFKYLAMIESGLNPRARSWASAVGMWQFVAATGRAYDLNVNAWVDDRMDPELATRAAARHLKDLYRMYDEDWHVAMAGYNCSPRCIKRAIRSAESRGVSDPDYWDIYPYLPRETRNYVPMFIATSLIASNPSAYDIQVDDPGPAYAYHVVPVTGMLDLTDIAEMAGTDVATIKALNPSLRRDVLPPTVGAFYLKIPIGGFDSFVAAYEALPPSARRPSGEYIVKRGDTLSGIGEQFGVSVSRIMQKNGLRSTRINIGQRLVVPIAEYDQQVALPEFQDAGKALVQYPARMTRPIAMQLERAQPTPESATPVVLASNRSSSNESAASEGPSSSADSQPTANTRVVYQVRSGDTLSGIALRHGVSIRDIQGWNGFSGTRINSGQRLTIYTDGRDAPAPPSAPITYVVKRGDTLSQIAMDHSVTLSQLRGWNNIRGSSIRIGQRLSIRPGEEGASYSTHTVRRGDTLIGIAQRYGVSVANIKEWNNLTSNTIHPGQSMKIFR